MEILQGVERRRRWSASEKARIVEEASVPGAVFAAVARRHGISSSLLWGWRRAARIEAAAHDGASAAFLPVRVLAVGGDPATPPDRPRDCGMRLEIRLSNGTLIRLDGITDPALLTAAIAAVR